ncbi:MAG: ABC transporter ATP-binding protein [Gorillibacterium sp.]|nr:ABC transporter ATP-binding protein [Gorillibacterium sp.]
MIEIKNVSKCYGEKKVVDGLSFSIKQGELFGFLGPNGAGKTTTIRMMIGLLKPTEGEVWINHLNVLQHMKQVQADIGVVFEAPNLYVRSTIRENLNLFASLYSLPAGRVDEVMESLQLQDRSSFKVSQLSKGWKQRVLIARALLHQPRILFLDEPTSGLDPNTAALIRDFIKQFKQAGTTIVLTTHDMIEADELSDRVGIMYNGKLVAMDHPQTLKSTYGKKELRIEFMKDGQIVIKKFPTDGKETAKQVYDLMTEREIVSIHTKEATLADVFAALTGSELS